MERTIIYQSGPGEKCDGAIALQIVYYDVYA